MSDDRRLSDARVAELRDLAGCGAPFCDELNEALDALDAAEATTNSWYMKCRELERAAEESARNLAAWNWCDHCRQLVDADDVHDGSEVKCLGCERVYVCTAFDGGEWRLFEAKELDEDSAADADAVEWRARAEAAEARAAEGERALAILREYGATLSLPYLPEHSQAYFDTQASVALRVSEAALALAKEGKGT